MRSAENDDSNDNENDDNHDQGYDDDHFTLMICLIFVTLILIYYLSNQVKSKMSFISRPSNYQYTP